MANFIPKKHTANEYNNGKEYVGYDPSTGELGDFIEVETINNLIESALYSQNTADSAVEIAQGAKDLIENTIQGQSIPPAIGLHHIQFSGEPTPAEIWAGTTWEIDTDYQGRSIIGSGGSYALGAIGGSADAVVVAHEHLGLLNVAGQNYVVGVGSGVDGYVLNIGSVVDDYGRVVTASTGVSGAGKNMPPYIVVNYWKRTA